MLTSDPRIVKKALPVPLLTYEEATELAFFGAQVLHPQAMQPALQSRHLAVRVKNSYNRQVPFVSPSASVSVTSSRLHPDAKMHWQHIIGFRLSVHGAQCQKSPREALQHASKSLPCDSSLTRWRQLTPGLSWLKLCLPTTSMR